MTESGTYNCAESPSFSPDRTSLVYGSLHLIYNPYNKAYDPAPASAIYRLDLSTAALEDITARFSAGSKPPCSR